ncbi:LAME_0C04038g1_1 [Lachancea meyersii CBS 8951]|uniref:LAME_0C04038g1_1 n=1 Tax=Lachancea meyersii CBS 8951 TaxID=1266667 RepID=A0A1G4J0K5_9SACH|nr:LAME_0C04038g1_1 [Lachancea meyersii CBS 8951]
MGVVVHLWGLDGKPSIISPESVALFWLLNDIKTNSEITVVFSNNTDLSPNQELPILINGSKTICGFSSIVSTLCPSNSALESALLQFAQDQIGALTQYQLYLNRNNYDGFTRKIFACLLEWPLWYNTPLKNRSLARQRCETLGYFSHPDDQDHVDFNVDQVDDLVQSKAYKLTKASKARKEELLKSARFNLQFMNRLSDQLQSWLEARDKLEARDQVEPRDQLLAADYLVWANLFIQLELPDGELVREHLNRTLGKERFQEVVERCKKLSEAGSQLEQREPSFTERGNAAMSVYYALRRMVAL